MAKRGTRPKLETKEELMAYVKENKDTELPFNETVWNIAVEKMIDKERQFKSIETTDFEGNIKSLKVPNGAINPVSKYFQLMALPNFQKMGIGILNQDNDTDDEDVSSLLDELEVSDEEESTFIKELILIYFSDLKGKDLQFVVDRLSDYYTNYEFNEGSDKFLVVSAVSDELALRELMIGRNKGKDVEAKIEKVKKGYLNTLEGLKVLKKQSSKFDESKNKLTMFVSELEKAGELKLTAKEIPEDKVKSLVDAFRRTVIDVFREAKV